MPKEQLNKIDEEFDNEIEKMFSENYICLYEDMDFDNFKNFFHQKLEETYEKGKREEAERWINQTGNEHDNSDTDAIIQFMRNNPQKIWWTASDFNSLVGYECSARFCGIDPKLVEQRRKGRFIYKRLLEI